MPLTLRNIPQTFTQELKAKMEHAILRPEDMDENYALGKEPGYKAKPDVNARPDPANKAYNPYALGSTVFDAAKYFRMNAFNQEWLKKNRGILNSANENAKGMYRKAYDAEQFTLQAEEELNGLKKEIANRFERNAASGKVDPNVILKNILNGYPSLRRMDEGRFSGDLAPLSRPLDYRFEDVAAGVNDWANTINRRKGAKQNNADLTAASQLEKDAVMKAEGNALQKDLAPKSLTDSKSILWDKGAAVAWNVNAWYRQDEDAAQSKGSGLRVSSGGGGMPSTPHPYTGHITQWNALKADAAKLGLANEYGMPTDQYYSIKGGKPDWMVKADEAERQRTVAENPPVAAKVPLPSVQDDAAADKREAMGNRDYQYDDSPAKKSTVSGLPTDQKKDRQTQSRYSVENLDYIDPKESWRFQDGGWYTLLAPSTSQFESWRAKANAYKRAFDAALTPEDVDKVFNLIAAEPVNGSFNFEPIIAYGQKRKSDLAKRGEDANKRRAPSDSEIQEMIRPNQDYQVRIQGASFDELNNIYDELSEKNPNRTAWDGYRLKYGKILEPKNIYERLMVSVLKRRAEMVAEAEKQFPSPYEKSNAEEEAANDAAWADTESKLEALGIKQSELTSEKDSITRAKMDGLTVYGSVEKDDVRLEEIDDLLGKIAVEKDDILNQYTAITADNYVKNVTYKNGIAPSNEAMRLGIKQTQAQHIIQELWNQKAQPGYKSPYFSPVSQVGIYGKPDEMTDKEWAIQIVSWEIDYWQGKFDNAERYYHEFVDEKGYLKKQFSEDSYGAWANAYLTAEYNLQDAKNQMELLSDDLEQMIELGRASPDNRIEFSLQDNKLINPGGFEVTKPNYDNTFLNPSEKILYLYKLGKFGKKQAEAYLSSIEESIKVRFGKYALQ